MDSSTPATLIDEPPDLKREDYTGRTLAIKLEQNGRIIRLQIVYSPDQTLVNNYLDVQLPDNRGVQERKFTGDSLRQTLDAIISPESPISADEILDIWNTGRPIFEVIGDRVYIDTHLSGKAGARNGYHGLRK